MILFGCGGCVFIIIVRTRIPVTSGLRPITRLGSVRCQDRAGVAGPLRRADPKNRACITMDVHLFPRIFAARLRNRVDMGYRRRWWNRRIPVTTQPSSADASYEHAQHIRWLAIRHRLPSFYRNHPTPNRTRFMTTRVAHDHHVVCVIKISR